MLFGEQGGGHQHRDLLSSLRSDEGGTHGHFGLAETHVAAHHPIHRLLGRQVLQHLADGLGLVGGFLERKAAREGLVLELTLRHGRSPFCLALRIQIEQFRGHVANLLGRAFARLGPLVGAELVQRCTFRRGARVT